MAILGGYEIKRQMKLGNIEISPFNKKHMNSNSYDLTLGNMLKIYTDVRLDVRRKPTTKDIIIPESGFELQPGVGYLGFTVERTFCKGLVPLLNGKSTLGRLFVTVHQTAGQGDNYFNGEWTLEIIAMCLPVTIYPGIRIAQVLFETMKGKGKKYKGKYQNQVGANGAIPLE